MSKIAYVGLSGGVDSAVSAALLKRDGYDVVGVFIKIWRPEFFECTWERDRLDAMRVAVALGIPFREVDLSEEYEREVISDMTRSYNAGYTPNPDVSCNEKIKFGAFYDWARARGADYVATGHYARIDRAEGAYRLLRGTDAQKDQSYFLYRIQADHLPHILFPVGEYEKSAVRAIAADLQLPVAHKRDSQGLCFVGDVSMPDFLSRYIPVTPGPVVDRAGNTIGEHRGAALYTVGQRHGFTTQDAAAPDEPHYVASIDARANTLIVTTDLRDCMRERADLDGMHWVADAKRAHECYAQSRYREEPFLVSLSTDESGLHAVFHKPHLVSPGQSLVLYDGDHCLGGGKIR